MTPSDEPDDPLLDEGVALFLQEHTAAPLIDWLSRHPERAADLAKCLAEQAAFGRWLAPLRQPVHDPPAELTQAYSSPAPAFAEAPDHLAEYEIGRELGRGGMGIVYQANDLRLKRQVALKMVLPGGLASCGSMQRFRFEAKTVAGLDHPNIVPLYSVGESNGLPFFTMKLIEGGSLAARLARGRSNHPGRQGPATFSARESARLVLQVARAVHHAHQKGILHRDIKPGNILLDPNDVPYITDFGLARAVQDEGNLTQGGIVGTFAYMPPEQGSGERKLGPTADVYSLGAVLYELLTSASPKGPGPALPSDQNPGVDRDLETICLKCLEKDPPRRYPSAGALADDLERWLNHEPIAARALGLGGLVQGALRHRIPLPTLETRPAVLWAAAILFITHATVFALAWFDCPVYPIWLMIGFNFSADVAVLWRYHLRRYRAITPPERQSLTISLGLLVMTAGVPLAMGPLDPLAPGRELLPLYPAILLLAGLASFLHGMTHWGRFYLFGLAHLPVAIGVRFIPDWAPLIYAVVGGLALGWTGFRLRTMVAEDHQASRPADWSADPSANAPSAQSLSPTGDPTP